MIAARVEAARRAEVRSAARAWRAAGAIDEATIERIEAAYPDDRHRMAVAWRVLVFVIVTIAANALFFAVATTIHRESDAGPWLVFAACFAAATEFLLHRSRVGDNGSAAATSFWAIVYAVAGVALSIDAARTGGEAAMTIALLASAALCGVACMRWGYAVYGVFSAAATTKTPPAARRWDGAREARSRSRSAGRRIAAPARSHAGRPAGKRASSRKNAAAEKAP